MIIKGAHLHQESSLFLVTRNPIASTHPIFSYKNSQLYSITRHLPEDAYVTASFYSIGFSFFNKLDISKNGKKILDGDFTAEQTLTKLNNVRTVVFDGQWLHLETIEDYELLKFKINDEQFQ